MALRAANGLLDGVTALLVLLAVVWSGYALWDNSRVYAAADNVQAGLLAFKPQPQEDNSLSFGQLRDINPDVCGWLTLDGTAIDYPVVQGESNFTYLNTDVYGSFALAGSIFLDVDCDADLSGRYSLLYGHHMENGAMFGDVAAFAQADFFAAHTTGSVSLPDAAYTVELFACLCTDAYDSAVYDPARYQTGVQPLLDYLAANAVQQRPSSADAQAGILALSTCAGAETNGRVVVFGWLHPVKKGDEMQ